MILGTSPGGSLPIPFVLPVGIPAGTEIWVQWALQDVGAIHGVALSNEVRGLTP